MLLQLRATMILWMDSFHEVFCEHPFQHAAITLALSLQMMMLQSCTDLLQSQITTSLMVMHSAQPILQPSHFQPGRSIQVAYTLLMRRPIPQDVEVLIQMSKSIIARGVSKCETFGCDRTSFHHESCCG